MLSQIISYINKTWTTIDKLITIWKSNLIKKQEFF